MSAESNSSTEMMCQNDSCYSIYITHQNVKKSIFLYSGIEVDELQKSLFLAFHIDTNDYMKVTGLKDPQRDLHFPLSLLSKAPAYFASRTDSNYPFELVLSANVSLSQLTLTDPTPPRKDTSTIGDFHMFEILDVFLNAAPTGVLDRHTFDKCFKELMGSGKVGLDESSLKMSFDRLFDIFDQNSDGVIDAVEFLTGVSVLTKGHRDEKTEAAFKMYDTDEDGYISRDEMIRYLTSVFAVIRETSSDDVFEKHDVSPIGLATATTDQCFIDCDKNKDGKLSYDEFKLWYSKPSTFSSDPLNDVKETCSVVQKKSWSIQEIQSITHIGEISISEVFSILSQATENGCLSRSQFRRCFMVILKKFEENITPEVAEVIDGVFDIFDTDSNGVIDSQELLAGVSILCRGTQEEKVKVAFSVFDTNEDGHISLKEMETYLTSVFKVVFETTPSITKSVQVDPVTLAKLTTMQAFQEADQNLDGRLSFEEFRVWYTKGSLVAEQSTELGFHELKQLTALDQCKPNEVFDLFACGADSEGLLTEESFNECFKKLIDSKGVLMSSSQLKKTTQAISDLFHTLDVDGNGVLDFVELSSGLTVLCGGSQDDKVAAAFALYDANGDGAISKDEMKAYLRMVFQVYLKNNPDVARSLNATASEIAAATTEKAFEESANGKDKLNFIDFRKWYSKFSSKENRITTQDSFTTLSSFYSPDGLREIKHLTNLETYDVRDIFDFFRASADADGNLTREKFFRCFNKLIQNNGDDNDYDPKRTKTILTRLFDAFDIDNNGYVDIQELGAGFSLLCGGDIDVRVEEAFKLIDENNDGNISKSELSKYLASIFKVLFEASPEMAQKLNVTVEDLVIATTDKCFQDCDIDSNGLLDLNEFKLWYKNPQFRQLEQAQDDSKEEKEIQSFSLEETRKLSCLQYYSVREVFQTFAEAADEDGLISRMMFDECFLKLIHSSGNSCPTERVKQLLDSLFKLFDITGDGVVDFAELASGLSILAAGTRDEKVEAAFSLYDFNGDGVISLDEMIRYLTSIFRTIYQTNPSTKDSVGIDADTLAEITACEAFQQFNLEDDDKMTLEQFKSWYSQNQPQQQEQIISNNSSESSSTFVDMTEARVITNLEHLTVDDAFDAFAEYADESGLLSRDAFRQCFFSIFRLSHKEEEPMEARKWLKMIDHLFDVFDQDGNGSIDFTELSSGLSILCSGSRESKVRAAFELYDANQDNMISLDEMTKYLKSVFRVLYGLKPNLYNQIGVSADDLAIATAKKAFAEAGIDEDGVFSYEDFSLWYQKSSEVNNEKVTSSNVQIQDRNFSLEEARKLTNLISYSPDHIFELLAEFADENGFISREPFMDCFLRLGASNLKKLSDSDIDRANVVFNRIFDIFDTNGDGLVDFSELSSGISILCGGSREEKVRAAFSLFDYNQDGYISRSELQRYLTSVFKILKETNPDTLENMNVSPEELGRTTAEQALLEADLDRDGRLAYDEFEKWYTKANAASIEKVVEASVPDWFTIQEIRRLTNLESLTADEVFETLACASDDEGFLSREAYNKCFLEMVLSITDLKSQDELDRLRLIIDRLFDIFGDKECGQVDFTELATGMSILCGGSRDEKVRAAFSLYDYNQDGFISRDEMERYLIAVFKILYEATPEIAVRMGVSPIELGSVTAEQAFLEADTNKDGKISYEEFEKWYLQPSHLAFEKIVERSIPEWLNLSKIRQLTNLESYQPEDVFSAFATASTKGKITRDSFIQCFDKLIPEVDSSKKDEVDMVVNRLFDIFDTNQDGFIDYSELASGLSVLCGGHRDEKVKAAFKIFDKNQDGKISLEEMTQYLTSVFKVLYGARPETEKEIGVGPEELAEATAEQCFLEADVSNGMLHYEAFSKWYSQNENLLNVSVQNSSDEDKNEGVKESTSEIPSILKLDVLGVTDLFEIFAEAAPSGEINYSTFQKCFRLILDLAGGNEMTPDIEKMTRQLFDTFDDEGNNMIDFTELVLGLSVLSGSSMEEKLVAAFNLLDVNGDGAISLEEMILYMNCVFRIMYKFSKDDHANLKLSKLDTIKPDELARITAQQCFKESNNSLSNGKLDFDQFKKLAEIKTL